MKSGIFAYGELFFNSRIKGTPPLKIGTKIKLGEVDFNIFGAMDLELWQKVNESSFEKFFQKNFDSEKVKDDLKRACLYSTPHFHIISKDEYEKKYGEGEKASCPKNILL